MWLYIQRTGELKRSSDTGFEPVATGYAGHGGGRNNPELDHVANVGPLPRGQYHIGPAHNTPDHGPVTMALVPFRNNVMHDRAGFLIHGNNKTNDASHGCIVLDRATRLKIAASGDRLLLVIPG